MVKNFSGNCPCQSGLEYADCCERFISHQAVAENAEQLMRSRYTAFVLDDTDYLLASWHPDYRPPTLTFEGSVRWLGLTILDAPPARGDQAEVEFEALFLHSGQVDAIHERSSFVRESGQWFYTRGTQLTPITSKWKPGRNESCPCGSGRKFKRCCGA